MTSADTSVLLGELRAFFNDRLTELDAYVDFLDQVQVAARSGAPKFKGLRRSITPDQQRILMSCTYLQLYNLVEATATKCMDTLVEAVCNEKQYPRNFNPNLRQEWIRAAARTHISLSPDKRLSAAIDVCDALIHSKEVKNFDLEIGGGGNWDDTQIENIFRRVGVALKLRPRTRQAAKRHVKDDMGALALVKARRNQLAHGSISFVECTQTETVEDLVRLTKSVRRFLGEAVDSIGSYVLKDL